MDGNLWVAVLGVALAIVSLAWQAATFALSGGRIKANFMIGAQGGGAVPTTDPERLTTELLRDLAERGFTHPVAAVEVSNVGRLPVTVKGFSFKHVRGWSFTPVGLLQGEPMPFRLHAGESETWLVPLGVVVDFAKAIQGAVTKRSGFGIHVVVELADGRTKRATGVLAVS